MWICQESRARKRATFKHSLFYSFFNPSTFTVNVSRSVLETSKSCVYRCVEKTQKFGFLFPSTSMGKEKK